MEVLNQISQHLIRGEAADVARLVSEAITNQVKTEDILNRGLVAGMTTVGEQFKAHEIFLPDVLMAAKAMLGGMELIKPLLLNEGIPSIGKVVIGTVQGDLHDIGKILVGIMLKGAGFEVIDLGRDVAPEKFVETAKAEQADVIGMSALLTTTMPVMSKVVDLAKANGIFGKTKIIIGGAPVSEQYAKEIGADAYCFDGVKAVECVKGMVGAH